MFSEIMFKESLTLFLEFFIKIINLFNSFLISNLSLLNKSDRIFISSVEMSNFSEEKNALSYFFYPFHFLHNKVLQNSLLTFQKSS